MKNNCFYFFIIATFVVGMSCVPFRLRRQFDWDDASDNFDDQPQPGTDWNDDGSTWNRPAPRPDNEQPWQQANNQQPNNRQPWQQANNQQQEVSTLAPITPTTSSSTTTKAPASFTRCVNACLTTSEYNPVCGTDGNTYNNNGRLRCAAACGARVQLSRGGTCQPQ